jgi:hypothetical protein
MNISSLRSGEVTFSPRVMMTLLQEADGVPVILSSLTNTGHVLLEVGPLSVCLSVCLSLFLNF